MRGTGGQPRGQSRGRSLSVRGSADRDAGAPSRASVKVKAAKVQANKKTVKAASAKAQAKTATGPKGRSKSALTKTVMGTKGRCSKSALTKKSGR